MNHKISRKIFIPGLVLCIALIFIGMGTEKIWLAWCGIGVFIIDLIQQLLFDRCPYCDAYFTSRAPSPKFCPRCGKEIEK